MKEERSNLLVDYRVNIEYLNHYGLGDYIVCYNITKIKTNEKVHIGVFTISGNITEKIGVQEGVLKNYALVYIQNQINVVLEQPKMVDQPKPVIQALDFLYYGSQNFSSTEEFEDIEEMNQALKHLRELGFAEMAEVDEDEEAGLLMYPNLRDQFNLLGYWKEERTNG